jgi:3-mercaptopyruvate sulfurtransferase SseA
MDGTAIHLLGYPKVFALKGGWDEWHHAKYPLEPK